MSTEVDAPQDEPLTTPAPVQEGRIFRICESSFILAVFAVSLVVEFGSMPQFMRDIPIQVIDANNVSYVRNLLFDQEELESTVGTATLVVVGVLVPFLLQLGMATWFTKQRRPFDRYNTFCNYFMAFAMTFLVVDVIKLYCGYLRPHFYDVCQPNDNYEVCTNDDAKEIREIRDSFPSGHAGLSLSGLGSFSLYLHRRFGVGSVTPDKANTGIHQIARLWSFLSVFPVLVALFIGTSRIHDNHHHPADVVAGFMIGGVCAYFCHHVWFVE